MTPAMLHQVWSIVESTQANLLLRLDDHSLVQWLLKQLENQRSLDGTETDVCSNYIRSKLPLIRELALQR